MPFYPFHHHFKSSCHPNHPPFSSATAAATTTTMHFSRLCFVLPSEGDGNPPVDHHHKQPNTRHKHRSCGIYIHDLLRRALHRLNDKRPDFDCCGGCRRQQSSVFHDTQGVQFPNEKVFAGHSPKIFGYSELYIGTKGFSKDEILGSGGFGRVYRAVLPSDGTVVAVKCLVETGERFEKTFAAELAAVAHLRHRNLVPLRGWCVNDDQLLLVYDYMPNRSLDRVLFGRAAALLAWERRVKIVKGLAAALFYLHEQLEAQIIHRDVKTSNVMLDSRFNARLGDFGLARWLEHELKYQIRMPSSKTRKFKVTDTSRIGGTIGYLSPESFQKRGVATAKSDVFSFGIVLLEIASGRKAVDLAFPDDRIILLDWIRELADDQLLLQAADHRLRDGSYKLHDMEHLIRLGLLCTLHDPESRPNMRWIVDALSGNNCEKIPDLPSFKSHPRYISISPPISSSNNSNTATPPSTITTTTVATISVSSTAFISAKGESLYATTELGSSDDGMISTSTSHLSRRQSKIFPMVQPPREISYKEIISATDNFSDSNRLAEVDFGTAYYGVLDDHDIIVKRLSMKTCPALRARFSNELSNLGRLCHRNLVQLHGWCTEQGEMLVVYNYSANRVLGQLLYHHNHRAPQSLLQWDHRYNIVKSLAGAIQYLHNEWEEQVIHRNITSSAICIEPDMNPRLGSFALAEFLTRKEHDHHVEIDKKSSVHGIFGYMAPEYMGSGEATPMADVYSFGVVVLEVVSGQMAVDFRTPDVLLVKRVHEFETQKRDYKQLVDPRLGGEYDHKEMVRLVKLAIACTRSNPDCRPTMSQVVSILDGRDKCLTEIGKKKENTEEWKERNALSLSLVRRVQALGIQ
ncbi:Concanavalin A-like lectin/glucanase, subgroup [Cynara cardunculus var. scolymus]|uniref:Concanavalin A-like lectin/glucanase, subgroup n=2 Tax=Cynara cardunculus var. scolymus TaxID=59895 RepID=A0A103Y0P7_CYNCS|nr:Concanavalin A-like lectin/glucanase, subgroup [Cynara cardunculus var. scolymus]